MWKKKFEEPGRVEKHEEFCRQTHGKDQPCRVEKSEEIGKMSMNPPTQPKSTVTTKAERLGEGTHSF